jgi:hypothetical protein
MNNIMESSMFRILSIIGLLSLLTACNGQVERNYSDYHPQVGEDLRNSKMDSIVTKSKDPIVIYGGKKGSSDTGAGSGMAGSYLWKASLESIAFMPLISSDSNGGAIITDWYAAPESPNEQFKFNIFILNPELQVTSIKVVAFKQVRGAGGQWHSVIVNKELARNVEDNILKKAISLRAKADPKKKK